MRWARASAQLIRPFPLSSHCESGSPGDGSKICRGGRGGGVRTVQDHLEHGAIGEHAIERLSFTAIDGEPVFFPYFDRAGREPALVARGEPFGRVEAALPAAAAPVDLGRSESEVEEVAGEPDTGGGVGAAKAAVVRFGDRDDVFDIGFAAAFEVPAGIWTVNRPPRRWMMARSMDWG